VRAAVAAKEAEWSARDDAMTRKAEENDAKLEEARETTRRLFVVHAAQRRAWASERVELLRRAGDASDAAGGGADASKHVQAAVEVAFRKKASSATKEDAEEEEEEEEEEPPATPGTALERLFAATTSASKSAPAEGDGGFNACEGLLRDAMEAEVVEAIVRGYCVDEDDGSVIVGASAIVEHVVRRYEEDPAATSRRRKIAAAAAAAGATVDVPSSAPPSAASAEKIEKIIHAHVDAGGRVQRSLRQLSGGERRRAALALALAHADLASSRGGVDCDLLVLDEVLQHLDGEGVARVAALLRCVRGLAAHVSFSPVPRFQRLIAPPFN
jgi:hypothetical protein